MKLLASIAICTATFWIGIWLGSGTASNPSPAKQSAPAPTESLADSTSPEAKVFQSTTGGDARLSRLLTSVKERSQLKRRHEFYETLRDVTAAEIVELIARAEKLPPIYRRPLLVALVERWLELDFAGAREWITSHRPDPDILMAWARIEPASALEEAFSEKKTRGGWRPDSFKIALEALAGPNLGDQVARLAQFPPGRLRDHILTERIAAWADRDPDAAFRFANGLPPGKLHDDSRTQALLKWAAKDPAEAVAHVKQIIPELTAGIVGSALLTQMADEIAHKDPQAAVQFARDLPPEFRSNPVIAAGREWAKTDPIAALEWARELGVDVTRGMRTGVGGWSGAVLKEAMLNHPETTAAWVEAITAGAERDRLIERAMRERLDNVSPNNLFNDKNEPIMRLFNQLPLESQQRAANAIGQTLAMRPGFSDLRTIMSQFEDETSQLRAMNGAFTGLCRTDEQKAQEVYAAYTANLPPGPAYDTATSAFAMGKRGSDSVAALEQAIIIRDPAILRTTMDSIMRDWMFTNAKSAQKWLADSKNLPPDWVKKWQAKAAQQQQ
jgi:hypothetical protein